MTVHTKRADLVAHIADADDDTIDKLYRLLKDQLGLDEAAWEGLTPEQAKLVSERRDELKRGIDPGMDRATLIENVLKSRA